MPCVSSLARPLLLAKLDILIDDPSPRVYPPMRRSSGSPALLAGLSLVGKLFDYLLLPLRLDRVEQLPLKRRSRVSNRLPIGTFIDVPPQTGGNDSAAVQLKHYLQRTDRADKISIASPC